MHLTLTTNPIHPLIRAIVLASVMLVCLSPGLPSAALAQSAIGAIDVVRIDAGEFPNVTVHARILDADGQPVEALNPDDVILTEDNSEVEFSHQAVDAGAQVALVADLGAGSSAPAASGQSRLEEIRARIGEYIDALGDNDAAMLIEQDETGRTVVQAMTPHKPTLHEAAESLDAERTASVLSNTYGAILAALDELANLPDEGKPRAVVVFTGGVQNAGPVTFDEVVARSTELGIPVYPVLVNSSEQPLSFTLQTLAEATGGAFLYSMPEADLSPVLAVIAEQSIQYELTYRSNQGTSDERTVALETRGGGANAPRDFDTYAVEIAPPEVVVDTPEDGEIIVREAGEVGQSLDEVEPTEVRIAAHVEWPDEIERDVLGAQLLIDEQLYGEPVSVPGTVVEFAWDVRPFRTAGETAAQVQVQVSDELGYSVTSDPVDVTIDVRIPETAVEAEEAAAAAGCMDGASGIFEQAECLVAGLPLPTPWLLLVPVVLVALLVWQGRAIMLGIGSAINAVIVGAFTRITHPVEEEPPPPPPDAEAYVTVVQGSPGMEGESFPLYAGHVTPMGRDAEQSDVVLRPADAQLIERKHCEIRHEDGHFKLRDFASTSGTYLNGIRLEELGAENLEDGDEIGLGPVDEGGVVLRFETVRKRKPNGRNAAAQGAARTRQ
ncbi:MAG TPA: FHA domain-containing protein [Aggregatilineales bacterium]|nr:FHA domain-containing protein [Aggregatilineales bacterium]